MASSVADHACHLAHTHSSSLILTHSPPLSLHSLHLSLNTLAQFLFALPFVGTDFHLICTFTRRTRAAPLHAYAPTSPTLTATDARPHARVALPHTQCVGLQVPPQHGTASLRVQQCLGVKVPPRGLVDAVAV